MTEKRIPQDMNFTLGCLCALMLFCFIQAYVMRAHSLAWKVRSQETNHVQFLSKCCEVCHYFCKRKKKKMLQDSLLYWHSLESSTQKKLCWTYPVSVWGNLWGLKLSTVEQQPAQSQLDDLSRWKVAEQLTIKPHACRQQDICADSEQRHSKTLRPLMSTPLLST